MTTSKRKAPKSTPPAEEAESVVSPVSEEETQSWSDEVVENTGKAIPQQSDWGTDETGEPVPTEDTPTEDDWSSVPVPLTLNISTHSGQFNPDEVKMLIYGETGTQKTRLAATFPDVLFADIDHGMNSVDWEVAKVFVEDNDQGFEQLKSIYEFLKSGNHEYTTVVLDTLNEMQRVIMRYTVEEFTHVRRSYGNLPGMSDYGKMLYEFMELTRNFISLPMRVILLAQVNSQQFENDMLMPQMIGKNSAREILRKMDSVGYIYKSDQTDATGHKLAEITFDSATFATKDRSNKLPASLLSPSYDRIAAFWK